MAQWSFWDWVSYSGLWLAVIFVAIDGGLRSYPQVLDRSPRWFQSVLRHPWSAFVPLAFVMISTGILLSHEFVPSLSTPISVRPINDPREGIRKSDAVTLIDPTQNGVEFERIPNGRFGYVTDTSLKSYITDRKTNRLPVYFSDDLLSFEVHKTERYGFSVIGFLPKTDIAAFHDPTRQKRDYSITNHAYKDFTVPVGIPFTDIERWEARYLPELNDTIADIRLQSSTH